MPSNIPLARERILHLIDGPDVYTYDEIINALRHEVLPLMTRVRTKPVRARSRARKVTAEMAEDIRNLVALNPDASILKIAEHYGTNPGRISEALAHLR